MKNKLNVKSLVIGTIFGGMLMSGVSYASSHLTSIDVSIAPITFLHNGQQVELEDGKNSFIYEGSTYVPVRWISETLGKKVEWDEGSRTISISDPSEEGETKSIV